MFLCFLYTSTYGRTYCCWLIRWGTVESKKKIEDFPLWRNHLFSVFSDIIFLLCSQHCHNLNGHFVSLEWIYFLSLFLCIPIAQTLAVASFLSRVCQDCYDCWWHASTVRFFTEHKNEGCGQYTKIFFFQITLFFFLLLCATSRCSLREQSEETLFLLMYLALS